MAVWLTGLGITGAAPESTGVYWCPVYHALAAAQIEVCVCNAAHMRNVPGRKTDIKDCQWIAELHEHGLLRPSFIPAQQIAALRARWYRAEAMRIVLDWLESFPGDSWQDRWLLSGSDEQPRSWGPPGLTPRWRNRLTSVTGVLIVLRAIRPGYSWLSPSRLTGVYDSYRQHNQAEAFADLARLAARDCFTEHEAEALNALTRMTIVTGKGPAVHRHRRLRRLRGGPAVL